MGNICGKGIWNDQQVMQSWLPLLSNMFIYDPQTDDITGVNLSFFSGNIDTANDQIRALPLLLKGKAGVSRKTLKNIKKLHIPAPQIAPDQTSYNIDTVAGPSTSKNNKEHDNNEVDSIGENDKNWNGNGTSAPEIVHSKWRKYFKTTHPSK